MTVMERVRSAIVVLALAVGLTVMLVLLVACAGKPGTEAFTTSGTTIREPTGTHSLAQLGYNESTQISGPLSQETSRMTVDDLQETSGGSAAKQRLAIIRDGASLRVMFSAASDLRARVAVDADGKITGYEFATDNTSVQKAVNEGIIALVAQWQRASDNERAVLEAKIKAQADLGDAVARSAMTIIMGIK
jgi:hypothetical protein